MAQIPATVGPSMNGAPHNGAPSQKPEWAGSLMRLAKTAQLKKYTLELKMSIAQVLSAQDGLELRKSTLQDIKAQKNWLDSERLSLLKQLEMVIADRNKAITLEKHMQDECDAYQSKITTITEGLYSTAKSNVDSLRRELNLEAIPSLQSVLDERSSLYLQERRKALQKRSADVVATYTDLPRSSVEASSSKALPSTATSSNAVRPARGAKRRREVSDDDDDASEDHKDDNSSSDDDDHMMTTSKKGKGRAKAASKPKTKGKIKVTPRPKPTLVQLAPMSSSTIVPASAPAPKPPPSPPMSSALADAHLQTDSPSPFTKRRGRPKGSKNKPKDGDGPPESAAAMDTT